MRQGRSQWGRVVPSGLRIGIAANFTSDQVDVGKSLAADNNQKAKNKSMPGHGHKGVR